MLKAVLFDLDGTLLPMDQDLFLKMYFNGVAASATEKCDGATFMKYLYQGVEAMLRNDGSVTNEDAFWRAFTPVGEDSRSILEPILEKYYSVSFVSSKEACGYTPLARKTVDMLHKMDIPCILATNPLFPTIATEQRISWAGLHPSDFIFVTTYENISYSKPNPDYYKEILRRFDLTAEECLMVGNDTSDDMIARTIGMQVFLLTPCLINTSGEDIFSYPHGDFDDLATYIQTLTS
ncbi:MAG: HAD family hydrolase [Clostridia bacterium]|nr:HAD family hydrolase [Clostridia bacterium]